MTRKSRTPRPHTSGSGRLPALLALAAALLGGLPAGGAAQEVRAPGTYLEPWVGGSWTGSHFAGRNAVNATLEGSVEVGLGFHLELDRPVNLYARGRLAPLTSVEVVDTRCETDCEVKERDGMLWHASAGLTVNLGRRGFARAGVGYQGFAEETQEVECQLGEPLCNGLRRFGLGPDAAGVELGLGYRFPIEGFAPVWIEIGDFITSGKDEASAVQHLVGIRAGVGFRIF